MIKKVKLGDICEVRGGYAFKSIDFQKQGIPVIRISNISDNSVLLDDKTVFVDSVSQDMLQKYSIHKGDILVALSGATTGKFGIYEEDTEALLNQRVAKLIPSNLINNLYLYYYLNTLRSIILQRAMGVAQPNISPKEIEDMIIFLPLLETQIKIAQILDQARRLIDKRKEQIALLDDLIQSVFYDMFGDPGLNSKEWECGRISDIIVKTQYGTSTKANENEGEYAVLRMNNITYRGNWDLRALKYIDLDEKDRKKYLVYKGEVLFNRTNSKELVGKTAVYKREEPMAYAGYLVKAIPNNRANGQFIASYMNTKYIKSLLFNMAKNIVGMANINAEEFKSIKVYIPPIELQNHFAEMVENIEKQKELLNKSLAELETNFNSLMQRAFRGELVAE
ncbi:restriction endonuclease subunit S [Turicibacter faecis]|uniref:Restriction endonuclease subunit S n=1 Tax=Turicibacter faecis TaxID=2963365 RepID=A0ABN6ZB21_9FIRM|nr:restriction endonuclease subunit S [Turicibacter sp. TS3]NCE78403.1 restriction endonuclease subunit S [Turicibacter sp. TS3]BEH91082.1 restriction endonuclease subunit S [Turicibacter sp. TC023]